MTTPSFVFVVGPTAAGKSALALDWAMKLGGEIVNCDSVQSYEKLGIGAAKPSVRDFASAPHHLYGYVPLDQKQGAGEHRRAFFRLADDFSKRSVARVLVVGGTGFYFQAIEKGMYPTRPSFPEIRESLEQGFKEGKAIELYDELVLKDPKAAARIERNDHYRIGRALEVIRGEGRSLSEIEQEFAQTQTPFPYPLLKIGVAVDRETLRKRVHERVSKMLSEGLIEEVQNLIAQGFENASALQSIGYRECLTFLQDNKSKEWLIAEVTKNTMQLAKRQMTWFRRDPEIHWVDMDQPGQAEAAFRRVCRFFGSH